jgi:hypothetical protein
VARSPNAHATLGAKMGPRVAQIVADAMTEHLRQSGHHRARIGAEAAIEFCRTITAERDAHWRPLLELILDQDELPPELEQAIRFAAHGKGEAAALSALSMVSGVSSQGLGALIGVMLEPFVHLVRHNHPNVLLDPSTVAQLLARGFLDDDEAESEAGGSGVDTRRLAMLLELAIARPDPLMLVQMVHRGLITEGDFAEQMQKQGYNEGWAPLFLQTSEILLSPEDNALLVLKGAKAQDEAEAEAAKQGVTNERFRQLIAMTGEPPGLEQLQEYLRREFITVPEFEHAVKQSRVRDEYMPVLIKARFQRASPSDALRGVIQNHLSEDEGKRIAEENGLAPEDWGWLLETEGNPIAPMQAITLLRRGEMSEDAVRQAIREGRTKDRYIDNVLQLRRAVPSIMQIKLMLEKNSISEKEGARLLYELGYGEDVVPGFIKAAAGAGAAKEKGVTRGEVQELYFDNAITRDEALDLLQHLALGKHAAEETLITTDVRRARVMRAAAMTPIRTAYLAGHITAQEASSKLDALGVPSAQRDQAIKLWGVDKEARHKSLNETQITKANTLGVLSDGAAESRLEALGYTHEDSQILLDLERGRTAPAT